MAKNRIVYVLSLFSCLVFFLAYRLWFAWFALITVLCLPLFSLLMSLLAIFTARLRTDLPHRLSIGTEKSFSISCDSLLPAPPWRCKRVVERPLTGEKWVLRQNDPLPTDHCGGLICSVEKPRIYDYLGLFCFRLKPPHAHTLVVYPKPVPTKLPALYKFRVRSYKPKWGGGFAENHELRPYVPGDSIRQIHWKLSAKTGSLILRQPMEPDRRRLLLQLDLQGSAEELDRKFGRLLWAGQTLLDRDLPFELQALTGQGTRTFRVATPDDLTRMMDELLSASPARSDATRAAAPAADWLLYIGGGADET